MSAAVGVLIRAFAQPAVRVVSQRRPVPQTAIAVNRRLADQTPAIVELLSGGMARRFVAVRFERDRTAGHRPDWSGETGRLGHGSMRIGAHTSVCSHIVRIAGPPDGESLSIANVSCSIELASVRVCIVTRPRSADAL